MKTLDYPTRWRRAVLSSATVVALFTSMGGAQQPAARAGGDGAAFDDEIRPILAQRCIQCHNANSKQGGLDLSTSEGLYEGGKRGPVVVPGKPAESLLLTTITYAAEPRMPVGADQLPAEEIEKIRDWIKNGARTQSTGSALGASATGQDLFREHIRPLFENTCLKCHSADAKASGLELTSRVALLRGGNNGPAVVPGDAEASLLYKAVAHIAEPHMPFRSARLPQGTIDRIRAWVDQGAPYNEVLEAHDATPLKSDHWAFQQPQRPAVPKVENQAWSRNPIDAFVAATHEEKGLHPVDFADKRTLLRRLYLDLIGVPPTRPELDAFLADTSKRAYGDVVDRLLASPQYGERWGRHWMDVWRYSDWYGWSAQNQVRYSQRHIWRWRDWIIESLNNDKGYDQMVREMLAGDEIAPADPAIVSATGYLGRNWYRFNRNVWLQDAVEYTSAALLGLTMKCARCHDHKYDPILQTDYYRLRAFFEPHDVRTDRVAGEPDTEKAGLARVFDAEPSAQTYRFIRGNEEQPDKEHALSPGIPRFLGSKDLQIKAVKLPLGVYYPDLRPFVERDLLAQAEQEIQQAEKLGNEAQQELDQAQSELSRVTSTSKIAELQPGGPKPSNQNDTAEGGRLTPEETEALAQLDSAEAKLRLAQQRLAEKRAYLPALKARIQADKAKYGIIQDDAEALAEEALELERQARMVKAEADLTAARRQLTEIMAKPEAKEGSAEEKGAAAAEKKKNVAEARKQLEAALEALKGPTETYTSIGNDYPQTSTGRRLALARWITSNDNPLAARVAINHMWLRHFGKALVPTMANFGSAGKLPSHPKLLDWLAAELMDQGWSMKHIHRLMVTSNTYRLASWAKVDPKGHEKDPSNTYLWRMNPRRMEAEAVRDSVLSVAGHLDSTMGGPEIDETEGQSSHRRSLYFRHTPESQMTFLKLFDAASPIECFQRNESVTPHQSLALANSRISFDMSRLLARQLSEATGAGVSETAFLGEAFESVLGRPPSNEETAASLGYLQRQATLYRDTPDAARFSTGPSKEKVAPAADPDMRARESLVHVLFNHNEFVTIR